MKIITTTALALLITPAIVSAQNADQQFVNNAAQINMTEAHVGQMAQRKGISGDVKQYGQRIENDHKKAFGQLEAAASGYNVPRGIDSQHQQNIDKLDKLSGQQFDQQFRQMMINDHQKAIDIFQKASAQLGNQALRNYANEQLPVLRGHLDAARELGTNLTSSTNDKSVRDTASAHTGGMNSNVTAKQSLVQHGTVTRYEPGKLVELKVRNRVGRHVYDISDGTLAGKMPDDIRIGSTVTVTEMIDQNGHRALLFQTDKSGTGGTVSSNPATGDTSTRSRSGSQ